MQSSSSLRHTGRRPDLRRIGLAPDFWYPVAQSKDVKSGRAIAAAFAGIPVALYRSESGVVFALEDRCAHRQVPLREGVVCGEQLRCFYHGWTYDGTGKVVAVPHLPAGARWPVGVRAFPCREAYGHVFIFPGDPGKAQTVPFPEVPLWSSPRHGAMCFRRRVGCHYSFMHENLMDMTHQFLHRGILGRIRPTLLNHRHGDDWAEAQYRFNDDGGRKHPGAGLLSGNPKESEGDIVTIRTSYPYQTLTLAPAESSDTAFHLWAAYVPDDAEQRTNRSFGILMIRKPKIPGLLLAARPFIRRFAESVFAEDRRAVEAEQRAFDGQGGDWNQEISPLILALREVLARNGVLVPRDAR